MESYKNEVKPSISRKLENSEEIVIEDQQKFELKKYDSLSMDQKDEVTVEKQLK